MEQQMIDFFKKKSVAALKAENEKLTADARQLANQVEYLVRTIRDMDQEIWNMSPRTDWTTQRPHYNKLLEGTIARKHAESERIGTLIREETIKTYSQPQIKYNTGNKRYPREEDCENNEEGA